MSRTALTPTPRPPRSFVLVHSPHLGPVTWEPVSRELRERGHQVAVPSLQVLQSVRLDFVMRAAAEVRTTLQDEGIEGPVVLVGHDWAGPLLPAIEFALAARVVGRIFVDAHLPRNGASPTELIGKGPAAEVLRRVSRNPAILTWSSDALREVIPDARLRDRFLSEVPRLPTRFYDEPIPVPGAWTSRPSAYLRFTSGYPASVEAAGEAGWPLRHLEGSHVHMLSEPLAVAQALEELAAALDGPPKPVSREWDPWPGPSAGRERTRSPGPRVVLVDDDEVGRAFLRARLAIDGIRVVAEAVDGDAAVAAATRTHPDVVVVDSPGAPGSRGPDATRAINDALPDAEVIVVGRDSPVEVLVDLIRRAAAHDRT